MIFLSLYTSITIKQCCRNFFCFQNKTKMPVKLFKQNPHGTSFCVQNRQVFNLSRYNNIIFIHSIHLSKKVYQHYKILVTVTQNVPQTNNTSTRGMNEEQCENISRNNQSPVFDSIMSIVGLLCYVTLQCATINQ